jgi:anaerobic C4-dicarboxylate transporter
MSKLKEAGVESLLERHEETTAKGMRLNVVLFLVGILVIVMLATRWS